MVSGRQRYKRYLIVSGILIDLLGQRDYLFRGTLPIGAVDHARLAEVAPPPATSHYLKLYPVVDYLDIRHYGPRGIIRLVQIEDRAFSDLLWYGRDVNPL